MAMLGTLDGRRSMRMFVNRSVWVVSLVALVLAGCAAPPSATPGTSALGASATATVPPGLVSRADGTVEATGYVGFSDLEGGFWALYDRPPGPSAVTPKIVAVLLPGIVSESGIAAFRGAHVDVVGRLQTGVSTRQAGPEVFVDSVTGVPADAPQ
jgi:hypothetical protein